MKYSLKRSLLSESYTPLEEHPLYKELIKGASRASASSWSAVVIYDHPSDGCSSYMHLVSHEEDPSHPNGIWVDKLEVVNTKTRHADPSCFRKGYARQALEQLVRAADVTRTHLTLIAAHEPYLSRQYPDVDFPDKDELAALYGDYGFVEDHSNYAQVHMSRSPRA